MPEPVIIHHGRPANPEALEYAMFLEATKDHELVVLHDCDLYRHLRAQKPGTRMWSWDIVTWPGHLATGGDVADGYTFAREPDMIDFFSYAGVTHDYYSDGAPSIDRRYWNEKLQGQRQDTLVYDEGEFLRQVREALAESEETSDEAQARYEAYFALADYDELDSTDLPALPPADKRAELLEEAEHAASYNREEGVHQWLSEHEDDLGVSDTWEWDLRVWDTSFVYACWCINFAAQKYQELRKSCPAPDDYVLVEGGVVQNNPAVPVFDLDVFEGPDGVEEAVELRERILAHPNARRALQGDVSELELFVRHYGGPEDAAFPLPPLHHPNPSAIVMEDSL